MLALNPPPLNNVFLFQKIWTLMNNKKNDKIATLTNCLCLRCLPVQRLHTPFPQNVLKYWGCLGLGGDVHLTELRH